MIYDLIIIGGGPAGVSSGIYAARKKMPTLLIAESFGGQSSVSMGIENWIGDEFLTGKQLADKLEKHLRSYEDENFVIKDKTLVNKIEKKEDGNYSVKTNKDEEFVTKSILIASGSSRRKLTVPGADEFEHKGITYCASCDGPFFKDKDVIVIGGGNSGFESASQLLSYCKSVTLLQRGPNFRADKKTIDKLESFPNFTKMLNVDIKEVRGDKFANELIFIQKHSNGEMVEHSLKTGGIFVEIGSKASVDFIDFIEKDDYGKVKINPKNQKTSEERIWAAGDCTDVLYNQNNIAVGDAVRATEDIYFSLKLNK